MNKDKAHEEKGRKLMDAVERVVDDAESIIATVDRHWRQAREAWPSLEEEALRDEVADRLVEHFAYRSAVSGGVSSLPAMLPGLGTALALTGGTLLDLSLMLKFEVEMALAMSWCYGFDIREAHERRLAFLLASWATADAQGGDGEHKGSSVAEANEDMSIWNYAPRQVPKLLVQVASRIALRQVSRGFGRLIPVVGVAVGSSMNRSLTRRVGARCKEELKARRAEAREADSPDDVVDAVVVQEKEAQDG